MVRTPVDIRLLYPPIGMAYIAGNLRSNGYDVNQLDLAAERKIDLRLALGLAECSRTSRVMLKVLFADKYPTTAEELHKNLMRPEVRHVSILPSEYSKEDVGNVIEQIPSLTSYCVDRVKQIQADVVGFHVVWDSALLSLLVAKKLKELDKDLLILFGGPDCSRLFRGRLIAHLEFVDAVATGEGERTSTEFLSKWEQNNGNLKSIKVKGCIINTGNEVLDHGEPELVSELDALSFPDYSDLPLRKYTGFYALPILTSRGCKYKCTFCVDRLAICSGTYRERSISNVVKEILHLHEKYRIKGLYFCDSSLNQNLTRLNKLCNGLMEAKKEIGKELYWGGDIRATPLTRGVLKKMYDVGCRFLMFGAESASQRILKAMGKAVTVQGMVKAFKWAKEAGVWVFTYWIVGYPREKEKDLLDSMRFIQDNYANIDEVCVAPCEVGFGSELYKRRKELGIRVLKSQIKLNKELEELGSYEGGYKSWSDRSGNNTPMERMRRRIIFEAVTRSLGYPSNWAIWPPMLPIDKLEASDVPVIEDCIIQKVEGTPSDEDIFVVPKSTLEPKRIELQQLGILELCDGKRSIKEISSTIHEKTQQERSLEETTEECERFLAQMLRLEIVKLNN